MNATTAYPLEIFFDGSCVVCSLEMESYRRRNHKQRLIFTDISQPDFCAEEYGLTQKQFMDELQVRDAEGRFFSGVDAFLALWAAFPDPSLYRLLGTLISLPGIRFAAGMAYLLFANFRHLLPKKAPTCKSGTCHLNHPRQKND